MKNSLIYNHTHHKYNMSMVVKNISSPIEKIKQILAERHGTLTASDLAKLGIARTYLNILERNGEIERVSRGVYRAADSIEDEMFSFQAIYQSSIYSHQTALYLHDLTDRSPLAYSISIPVGYHSASLAKSGHQVFYVRQEVFGLGVITMKSPHGNPIRATDLERTICDMVRSRNQIDIQLVYDAVKRYARKKEKNLDLLYRYAQRFRVQKTVKEMIEVLL